MAVSEAELLDLIEDARKERARLEAEITAARSNLAQLDQKKADVSREQEALVLSLRRLFPHAEAPQLESDDLADLSQHSRMAAVSCAVKDLDAREGIATPAGIEAFLHSRGRSDSRDAIGAALSYLRSHGKVRSISRGRWRWIGDAT